MVGGSGFRWIDGVYVNESIDSKAIALGVAWYSLYSSGSTRTIFVKPSGRDGGLSYSDKPCYFLYYRSTGDAGSRLSPIGEDIPDWWITSFEKSVDARRNP